MRSSKKKTLPGGMVQDMILLDARVKAAMRKQKLPYETWNGFFSRVCKLSKSDLGIPENEEHYGCKTTKDERIEVG